MKKCVRYEHTKNEIKKMYDQNEQTDSYILMIYFDLQYASNTRSTTRRCLN